MRHCRSRRNSKEKNQRYHAKVRALQRFEVKLTNQDLDKMAEIFRHSWTTVTLSKQSNRITKALVVYNGTVYPIVYDRTRHQIVTILKPEYLNKIDREKYEKCKARVFKEQETQKLNNTVNIPTNNIECKIEPEEEIIPEEPSKEENDFLDFSDNDENEMRDAFGKLNF